MLFQVNLSKLQSLQKIRLSHDSSGSDPSWFIERVRMKMANSDVSYNLDVGKWLSLEKEPFQMAVEVPIPKPGEELLPGLCLSGLQLCADFLFFCFQR